VKGINSMNLLRIASKVAGRRYSEEQVAEAVKPIKRDHERDPGMKTGPYLSDSNTENEITLKELEDNYPEAYHSFPFWPEGSAHDGVSGRHVIEWGPSPHNTGKDSQIDRIYETNGEIVVKTNHGELYWNGTDWDSSGGPSHQIHELPIHKKKIPQSDTTESQMASRRK